MTRRERTLQTETRPCALRGWKSRRKFIVCRLAEKLPHREKNPFMWQEERQDSRSNPPREENLSNFLNHMLRSKGRKAGLNLDIVKQETQLVHNRRFKSHFKWQEAAESCSHCPNEAYVKLRVAIASFHQTSISTQMVFWNDPSEYVCISTGDRGWPDSWTVQSCTPLPHILAE